MSDAPHIYTYICIHIHTCTGYRYTCTCTCMYYTSRCLHHTVSTWAVDMIHILYTERASIKMDVTCTFKYKHTKDRRKLMRCPDVRGLQCTKCVNCTCCGVWVIGTQFSCELGCCRHSSCVTSSIYMSDSSVHLFLYKLRTIRWVICVLVCLLHVSV